MRTLRTLCVLTALALVVTALPARADESNKLTYLTFSAPIDLPGMSLPAGRYRFELADPVESRRVIKVSSDKDQKVYGMFLTIPNKMIEAAKDPVVMFQEVAAGTPHPVKAWFYPGESIGYEFVYPHDQALKIAKATHESVLATDKSNKVGRVNENDQFSALKNEKLTKSESAALHKSTEPTLANSGAVTTVDRSKSAKNNAPAATTSAENRSAAPATTAQPTTGNSSRNQSRTSSAAVGTSGQSNTAASNQRQLPRTASDLPWFAVFSVLSFGGALGVRRLRSAIASHQA